MFKVFILMKNVGEYERFSEAFRVFFSEFKKAVKSGSAIPHTAEEKSILEAASFITCPFFGKTLESVMDFSSACEFGRREGLLKIVKGGLELEEELREPDRLNVRIAFFHSTRAAIAAAI